MAGVNGHRATLNTITGILGDAGLDPIPDEAMGTVAAKCPICIESTVPGHYPLTVVIANNGPQAICLRGCDDDAIRTAIPGLFEENGNVNVIGRALEESRVDLIGYMRDGIPPRKFVPGCHGRLAAGKRHHLAADRKTGKSLALGVVDVIDIIEADGTVAVLDRENGQDEYARRLDDVLKARKAGSELVAAIQERFRYYAWPSVKLEWATLADYPAAFDGVDLVIFDSSRKFLTHCKLEENKSDDYSQFAEALIDPLMRAGIATLILDNTGHEEKTRSRGSISKEDLADIIFSLKKVVEYNRDKTGRIELRCEDSRFGDVHGRWTMELGGGVYEGWDRPEEDGKETFRQAAIAVLVEEAPMGRDALVKEARERGAKGRSDVLRAWLLELAADPASGIAKSTEGYTPEGWPHSRGQGGVTGSNPGGLTPDPPPKGAGANRVRGEDPTPGSGSPPVDERFSTWQRYEPPAQQDDDDEQDDDERKDLA